MVIASVLGAALTILAGGWLLDRVVSSEAERRVEIALEAARNGIREDADQLQLSCVMISEWLAQQDAPLEQMAPVARLDVIRERGRFDYVHVVDTSGRIVATARGDAVGRNALGSGYVDAALETGRSSGGFRRMPVVELSIESPELAEQAYVRVTETRRARPGGPEELDDALVLEAASPIIRTGGRIVGAVQAGTVGTRDAAMEDRHREQIFTVATYAGKHLGTVTIFLDDVRVSTNVVDENGARAVGTRVSEEVYNQVLERGQRWLGPAFVVDTWYFSAYEPIKGPKDEILGMLYVGVLQKRYDDIRRQALGAFAGLAALATFTIVVVVAFVAGRVARPITRLTKAADRIAMGEFSTTELWVPRQAERYEVDRLALALTNMSQALRERDSRLKAGLEELRTTSAELERWNQNYLETLEFITHELKNQIAAMKINVLALHGGFIGEMKPEQIETLDDVHTAIVRTEEMILNYLNLSRIEKGELEVRARPVVVVQDVIRPVLRDLRSRFDAKSMTVEVAVPEDLSAHADPSLLQIVYENLMGNAAKYGAERGVVWVSGSRTNGQVELHVRNDGAGVAPERAEEMFAKFNRLQRPGEMARGSGLGLYITREIIRKHGGDIRVEGKHGEWIDFVFTLPRHDVVLGADTGAELIGADAPEGATLE